MWPDSRFAVFAGTETVIIAGSTWPQDEELLVRFLNQTEMKIKWIIAPHEIHEAGINRLESQIRKPSQRYTSLKNDPLIETDVIIVDTIGILSSLYQYGSLAYIGGGFGKGIHNTLEAATFWLPVIFGPKYQKFREAVDLVERKAAFPVHDYLSLDNVLSQLLKDPSSLKASGEAAKKLVKDNLGATKHIIDQTMDAGESKWCQKFILKKAYYPVKTKGIKQRPPRFSGRPNSLTLFEKFIPVFSPWFRLINYERKSAKNWELRFFF